MVDGSKSTKLLGFQNTMIFEFVKIVKGERFENFLEPLIGGCWHEIVHVTS